jgi:ABC-type multidrug transport system ATPase subunit
VDKPGAKRMETCEGEIKFNNVEFSYDGRKPALRGLDFVARPGTTTAFVGESGGGKTTVLRLLFRFYAIQLGCIEVDGQNVEDITIESLRSHVGVVPQDTVLFNETVMYNLRYANPDANDEMVYEACKAASIHDKILSFPDGYNTRVGERGLRLSGGEKQRVAIARTILKNPKIILLDEATAALDSETEQHIQAALKELARGRTMLVIAHRLSTIVGANQILCLHEGKVAEAGTHEELLARGGRYKGMWDKQIRAEKVQKAKSRIDQNPDTPIVSSSSSSIFGDEGAVASIPAGQNIGGVVHRVSSMEMTPKALQAEDLTAGLGGNITHTRGTSLADSTDSDGRSNRGRRNPRSARKSVGKKGMRQSTSSSERDS